jgi:hypothetical protein
MSLDLSPVTEARLLAKARERGLSVDEFVESLIDQPVAPSEVPKDRKPLKFPAWNLGSVGSLHRRDIYNDVL